MTAATQQLINALIGFEREYEYPADPADVMEWSNYNPELRYRRAALAALEAGDAAEAGVLSQLALAAGIEHVGMELFSQRDAD